MAYFKGVSEFAPVIVNHFDQTASISDRPFFISDGYYEVDRVTEAHQVAGNDAGAVTGEVVTMVDTQAPGAGTSVQSTTFDLKSAVDTVQTATMVSDRETRRLSPGDRLGFNVTGVTTTLAGVLVTVRLRRVRSINN